MYTIGHLRCRNGSKILSFGRTNKKNSLEEINPECVGGFGNKTSNGGTQYYQQDRIYDGKKVATSLSNQLPGGANYYTINQIGKLGDANRDNPNRFRVYDPNGIGASLDSGIGGGRGGHTIVPIDVESTTSSDEIEDFSQEQIKVANYPFGNQKSDIFSPEGISRTLAASDYKQPLSVVIPFGIDKGVEGDVANTLTAREDRGVSNHKQEGTAIAVPIELSPLSDTEDVSPFMYDDYNSKFRDDNIAGTLTPNTGCKTARTGQKVCIPVGDSINLEMPESETRRGRVGHQVAQTLTTSCNQGIIVAIDAEKPGEEHPGLYIQLAEDCIVYAIWYEKYQCYIAIRKLIPKECFRLQGWSDEYFERAAFVNTDSQLYKQAGNGVSVPVVEVVGNAINDYYLD